jgi:hypothetical protein
VPASAVSEAAQLSPEDEQLLAALQKRQPSRSSKRGPSSKQLEKDKRRKIIRVPAKVWREATALAEQPAPSLNDVGSMAQHYDFGRAAFDKIGRMREQLKGFAATHGARPSIPDDTRELVAERIKRGAASISDIIDEGDGHFLGYDFGTSTTKAVLRHPHKPTAPAFAVSVPADIEGSGQPHLWPTAVWYDPNTGRFSLLPADGWICLEGFKSAIVEDQGHRVRHGVTMLAASAAFLAMHIAYVIGTALERAPDIRISGVNFAAPVAALKDSRIAADFENLTAAALCLVRGAENLTNTGVLSALNAGGERTIPRYIFTELSAAIAGYCSAPRYYHGGHMIVDCGSATLDIASFTLGDERWPADIHGASVERLGADACARYMERGATVDECVKATQYQEHMVWKKATARKNANFVQTPEGKYPYQILIGGGIDSEVHRQVLATMEPRFRQPFHRPQLANDLQVETKAEPGRLILADGLARDLIKLPEVAMPDDRDQSKPPSPYPDEPPGPEVC